MGRGGSALAGNRSFKDYVADRFYNEIFSAIQTYATDNCEDLDLRLYRVRNIGGIELSDVEVKFVSVNDVSINIKVDHFNSLCE